MINDIKLFNEFTTEELFTEYIHSLIQQGKSFMMFPDNNRILIEEECDEWNKVNGITDDTPRVLYHHASTSYGDGYAVSYTDKATTVLIPADVIKMKYADFVSKIKADLLESVYK